jgi:hypothetical protein
LSWLGYVQTAEKLTGEHQLNRFKSSAFYIKFHARGLVLQVFSAEELGKRYIILHFTLMSKPGSGPDPDPEPH